MYQKRRAMVKAIMRKAQVPNIPQNYVQAPVEQRRRKFGSVVRINKIDLSVIRESAILGLSPLGQRAVQSLPSSRVRSRMLG